MNDAYSHIQKVNLSGSAAIVKFLGIMIVVLPAIFVGIVNWHDTYDDAFITYRYAYNFAMGKGFVYNTGERFMGTTAPLYGLILGGLGAVINPEVIPHISGYISALSLMLTGVALYEYGWLHKQPLCGWLAGLFYVVNPLLAMTFGGEILFQVMLIAWAFVSYKMERNLLAALLLALAMLTRPDGVIAAAVIGAHYLIVRRCLPLREMVCVAIVLLPFTLLAWIFYGSPLPGTLAAKLAQRDSGLWQPFCTGTVEWLRGFTIQGSSVIFPNLPAVPHAIRFILFVAVGIPATLLLFRFQLLPLAWVILYALGYHLLNVPFYHWYVVPVMFGLMILAAAGVAGLVEVIRKACCFLSGSRYTPWMAALLAVLCLLALSPGIYAQLRYIERRASMEPHPGEQLYERTGRWLEANTLPNDRVGYFEIGSIGYHSRRPMIDPLGLVNPGVALHVASRDFTWAYAHYRPEYIIINQLSPPLAKVAEEPWFRQEYDEVERISQPGYPAPLVIYKRFTPAPTGLRPFPTGLSPFRGVARAIGSPRVSLVITQPDGVNDTLAEMDEFATAVMGDPWDMNEPTDLAFFYPQESNLAHSAFVNGVYSAQMTSGDGRERITLLTAGAQDHQAMRVGKIGYNVPIDADRYRYLTFRMYSSNTTCNSGAIQWFADDSYSEASMGLSNGFLVPPLPCFGQPPGWYIYVLDLKTLGIFLGGTQWAGTIRELIMHPFAGPGAAGATVKLDWARLTAEDPLTARPYTIQWTGDGRGGPVTLYASPDDRTLDEDDIVIATDQSASGGSYTFQTGVLPAGRYYIAASNSGGTAWSSAPLIINTPPQIMITQPSMTSGREYAETEIGNGWDMNDAHDLNDSVPPPSIYMRDQRELFQRHLFCYSSKPYLPTRFTLGRSDFVPGQDGPLPARYSGSND